MLKVPTGMLPSDGGTKERKNIKAGKEGWRTERQSLEDYPDKEGNQPR